MALTAYSEAARQMVSLKLTDGEISPDQAATIYREQLVAFRDNLERTVANWQTTHPGQTDVYRDADLVAAIYRSFEQSGLRRTAPDAYLKQHFPGYGRDDRRAVQMQIEGQGLAAEIAASAQSHLEEAGLPLTDENRARVVREIIKARRAALEAFVAREDIQFAVAPVPMGDAITPAEPPSRLAPTMVPATIEAADVPTAYLENVDPAGAGLSQLPPASSIPDAWRHLDAVEVADLYLDSNPRTMSHRTGGKREAKQIDEHTKRQIRWAAVLLDKSMNPPGREGPKRPFWTVTDDDLQVLDKWFELLPRSCGKSPFDRDPTTTLEAIVDRGRNSMAGGTPQVKAIGFDAPTTNRHYRYLGSVHKFLRKHAKVLPEVDFNRYCTPDLKDERDARPALTIEQGNQLFALPPWTGCRADDRLVVGECIIHDALYFVPLLLWYTGARREEICKLLVDDIDQEGGVCYIHVRPTKAGGVKTKRSIRLIPVAAELQRLGFMNYVDAIRAAGHEYLFPELASERLDAKKGGRLLQIVVAVCAPSVT